MPEEYFDVAFINFDKAVLHGRITAGRDALGCRAEAMVEQVLTEEQREQLSDLQSRQHDEMQRLLERFVDRDAAIKEQA